MELAGDKPKYVGWHAIKSIVRAYGAFRFAAPRASVDQQALVKVANLFDPASALIEPYTWLRSLRSPGLEPVFDRVAKTIMDVLLPRDLSTQKGHQIHWQGDEPYLDGGPISSLSDAYRSIFTTVCDIMAGIPADQFQDMRSEVSAEAVPGIVLLDEVDIHLHPRWKMRVVETLRRAFPGFQFIATTHEPLCLHGLRRGEIILMRSDENEQIVAHKDELPSAERMAVDQLLTSALFGLESTRDTKTDEDVREYYALLRKDTPTEKEQERINALRGELAPATSLGDTRREQQLYLVLDEQLAREPFGTPITDISPETRRRVLDIWDEVDVEANAVSEAN